MQENYIENIAEPVVRAVVNCIADRRYGDIPGYSQLWALTPSLIEEMVEEFLALNSYPYIDRFETPCSFSPQYVYHQLSCTAYKDGSGFHVDYDLTTNGELNDLTLQMDFRFSQDNTVMATILDLHVL